MRKNIKLAAILLSTAIFAVGCGNSDSAKTTDKADTADTAATSEKAADVDYSQYVTLGTYKGIEVAKQTIEVTDEEVEAQIQSTLEANAVKEEITDRDTVQDGDVANIDYEGLLDGEAFEGGTDKGQDLTIGSGQFIDGFEEQLIGVKVGESVSINVTFPEDYAEELAGKDVVFNVKINSISKESPAELTDEFVQGISESQTVDEYRQSIREDLTKSKEEEAEYKKKNDIWTAVKDSCEVKEYPQELVDKYTNLITTNYSSYAQQSGVELDEFMTNYFGMSVEDYAKSSVADEMICKAIVKDAGIELTDEQFTEKATKLATTYGYESLDAFMKSADENQIRDGILLDVMMDYLIENAVEA